MELITKSQDWLCLIIVPLIFVTAQQVIKNWKSLWDNDLTSRDSSILMRTALFLLEPIVVLLHEAGHAAATIYFGGKIVEFHYAILSGYVRPSGMFTDSQILIVFVAGNFVSIAVGYLCLLGAYMAVSPPIVALLVYLGLWSIGSSAVLYALMSIFGLYGDWISIYTSPETSMVVVIGVFHALIVASLLYMLAGVRPRLWFVSKTHPTWAARFKEMDRLAQEQPTANNLVRLAWHYYDAELYRQSKKVLQEALERDPEYPDAFFLRGWINMAESKFDAAEVDFSNVTRTNGATDILKARAFMAIAQTKLARAMVKRLDPHDSQAQALTAYASASEVMPELGDPCFRYAALLNEMHRYEEAKDTLETLHDLRWMDKGLVDLIPEQLQIADAGLTKEHKGKPAE